MGCANSREKDTKIKERRRFDLSDQKDIVNAVIIAIDYEKYGVKHGGLDEAYESVIDNWKKLEDTVNEKCTFPDAEEETEDKQSETSEEEEKLYYRKPKQTTDSSRNSLFFKRKETVDSQPRSSKRINLKQLIISNVNKTRNDIIEGRRLTRKDTLSPMAQAFYGMSKD